MPNTNKRRVILIVADGWGIGAHDASNPLAFAKLPNLDFIKKNYLAGSLQASGLAVGLPWNEEGNSEVGHLTIGAGRIVYQSAARISSAINDGTFFKNNSLLYAIRTAAAKGSAVNLIGLVGSGMTHSDYKHLEALIRLAESEKADYKLHLFTDGRDSPIKLGESLVKHLDESKMGSIGGRFYGMDRDGHLERTQKAYAAIVGKTPTKAATPSEYIESSYQKEITDETILPASFNPEKLALKPEDTVIFFNFRADRMRQLAKMIQDNFPETPKISFTQYEENSPIPFAFSFSPIKNPLPAIIAENGLTQFHIAESEKYAHVTYFFNAENEEIYPGEFRIIIPSNKIPSHDKKPEMMAEELTSRVISAIEDGLYDFIIINFANTDMVAHTGNFDATIKAAEVVDKCVGKIKDAALSANTVLIFTADHGNAERLIDPTTGEKDTHHNSSPVPIYIVGSEYLRPKNDREALETEKMVIGSLADIAPTVLEIMKLPKPPEMTGQSLIPYMM